MQVWTYSHTPSRTNTHMIYDHRPDHHVQDADSECEWQLKYSWRTALASGRFFGQHSICGVPASCVSWVYYVIRILCLYYAVAWVRDSDTDYAYNICHLGGRATWAAGFGVFVCADFVLCAANCQRDSTMSIHLLPICHIIIHICHIINVYSSVAYHTYTAY
jgi:hypothetical protein